MAIEWNRFWCRVLFKEYIKHYRKMTDEQIVRDVRQSMDDLEDLVPDTDSFGSQMVRWSIERSDEPFATAARENGKKGGRPRKNPEENTAETAALDSQGRTGDGSVRVRQRIESPVRSFRFRNKEEYINWAADAGLDLVDAGECWDATVERGWKDADGKPVNNIKAFASQWCATREEKRNKRRSA